MLVNLNVKGSEWITPLGPEKYESPGNGAFLIEYSAVVLFFRNNRTKNRKSRMYKYKCQ